MRLRLDARARRWLKRLPVVNLYSAAELALMAVLAAQVARLIWAIATPIGPLGDWRPVPVVIPASPIETLTGFDPFFRLSGPADAGPVAVTSLQLTLFGTRIDDATGGGSAIVAGADGVQRSVSVGEEVAPGVRLAAVAFDHITLDRSGAREDLFLDQTGGAAPAASTLMPASPPGPGLAGAPAGAVGLSVQRIRQDIGFIPRIDGGKMTGLVVRSQGSGAAFREAGLRDGDVVTTIGGRAVSGADDLDRIARTLPQGGALTLTVERGGQPLALPLTIARPE